MLGNKEMKQLAALSLSVVMALSGMACPAGALTDDNRSIDMIDGELPSIHVDSGSTGFDIKEINQGKYEIQANGLKTNLELEETSRYRIAIFEEGGVKKSIKYDKLNNSLTNLNDGTVAELSDDFYPDEDIQPAKITVSYSQPKVSLAQIRSIVGDTASLAGMLAVFAAKFGDIKDAAIAAGTALALIGGVNVFVPNDNNHGLKFTIKTTKYSRKRLGMWAVWKIVKTVEYIGTY